MNVCWPNLPFYWPIAVLNLQIDMAVSIATLNCVENQGDALRTESLQRIRVIVDNIVSQAKTNGRENKILMMMLLLMAAASPKIPFRSITIPTMRSYERHQPFKVILKGTFWTDPFESTSLRWVRLSKAFKGSVRNTSLLDRVCQTISSNYERILYPTNYKKHNQNGFHAFCHILSHSVLKNLSNLNRSLSRRRFIRWSSFAPSQHRIHRLHPPRRWRWKSLMRVPVPCRRRCREKVRIPGDGAEWVEVIKPFL